MIPFAAPSHMTAEESVKCAPFKVMTKPDAPAEADDGLIELRNAPVGRLRGSAMAQVPRPCVAA